MALGTALAVAVLACSTLRATFAADPECSNGIKSGDACCALACGACGGPGCGGRPGGSASCCSKDVEATGQSYDTHDAPCVLRSPAPSPGVGNATVEVLTSTALSHGDEKFVSFTFDASAWRSANLSDPTLLMLASSLSPAVLRVGGTQADYDIYKVGTDSTAGCESLPAPMTSYRCRVVTEEQWTALISFAMKARLELVFGLNDMVRVPACAPTCP